MAVDFYDSMDGPSEEEVYLSGEDFPETVCEEKDDSLFVSHTLFAGEYKTILQLVGVLSHGKIAKNLTDRAIDLMQDVQNIRKAIYEYVTEVMFPL